MISKNIFYFSNLNVIGGVESFFYYMAKKYQDYDITIYYKTGDLKQIKRLQKYVRVLPYKGEHIKCEKAFFNYKADIIDNVEAKEYIQIIHANYKDTKTEVHLYPQITRYIGVSQWCCDKFKELTGIECECVYNPLAIDKPERPLIIVSATRLTNEKGKDNMEKFGNLLNKNKRPYLWFVFTNDAEAINNPNIVWLKPRLDISSFMNMADFVAQFSKSESYGYVPNEAATLGTPVLITPLPVYEELGFKDGEHGFIIDDFDNFDVNKLYEWKKHKIKYNAPEDNWGNILAKGKSTYKQERADLVTVVGLTQFGLNAFKDIKNLVRKDLNDNQDGVIYKDDIFDCDKDLANYLMYNNPTHRQLVKIYDEIE